MAPKKTSKYRNPANDLVDAAEASFKSLLSILKNSGKQSVKGIQKAGAKTGERLADDFSKDRSMKAEALRKREGASAASAPGPNKGPDRVRPTTPYYGPGGASSGSGAGQAQQANPYYGPGGFAPPAPRRSPAATAPIHAAPQAFGSAYAPQAGAAPRPNTPQPSAPQQNPYAGIGDVRGNEMGAAPSGGFGIDKQQMAAPRTPDEPDMERRRAFLDAPDSLSGMQAVRDLLNKRKLSISLSD